MLVRERIKKAANTKLTASVQSFPDDIMLLRF
jgi:hypothetical protein